MFHLLLLVFPKILQDSCFESPFVAALSSLSQLPYHNKLTPAFSSEPSLAPQFNKRGCHYPRTPGSNRVNKKNYRFTRYVSINFVVRNCLLKGVQPRVPSFDSFEVDIHLLEIHSNLNPKKNEILTTCDMKIPRNVFKNDVIPTMKVGFFVEMCAPFLWDPSSFKRDVCLTMIGKREESTKVKSETLVSLSK